MSNFNIGHGHVFPRPDGVKARCGGPGICNECSSDARLQAAEAVKGVLAQAPISSNLQSLPEHDFCAEHVASETYTKLELFIYQNQPVDDEEDAKEFRDGLLAVLNEARGDWESEPAVETQAEPVAWMAEDGRVCTADLKRSQKPIMTAGFTIPLYARHAAETPREPDSGWYVEEWLGGSDWRRHALAHIWETKADARKQLDDLMHRNPNTTFRLRSAEKSTGEPT